MLKPAVRAFLEGPHVARLSVIDSNGYPHTVPLWYGVDGDDIVMISDRNTRKVGFIESNSKASICIGGGEGANSARRDASLPFARASGERHRAMAHPARHDGHPPRGHEGDQGLLIATVQAFIPRSACFTSRSTIASLGARRL